MIEQGLVKLIQTGLTGVFSPAVLGGYAIQLPKDFVTATQPKAWTWRTIARTPHNTLQGRVSLTEWRVCIDSHGQTAPDAIQLSGAIDNILRAGFSGTLSDPDNTKVCAILGLPGEVSVYSDTNRTWVISTDYVVHYFQS